MGLTEVLETHFWSELQPNQKLATFWKCSLDSRVARKRKDTHTDHQIRHSFATVSIPVVLCSPPLVENQIILKCF